jgi:hypothetical protein
MCGICRREAAPVTSEHQRSIGRPARIEVTDDPMFCPSANHRSLHREPHHNVDDRRRVRLERWTAVISGSPERMTASMSPEKRVVATDNPDYELQM